MKKTILWISLLLGSAIAITGCGSNDKADPGSMPGSSNIVLSLDPNPIAAEDTGRGTYIARYAVHAIDANGNPKSRLPISVAIVNKMEPTGYGGAIHTTEPVTFTEYNTNFAAMGIRPGDTLIIIPTTYGEEELSYVGNWTVTEASDKLTLGADIVYNLVNADRLTYLVGNERSSDGYLAHIQRPDDSNVSSKVPDVEKGLTFFDIVFDKQLAGRCVHVGVHLSGSRTGTAKCVHVPTSASTGTSDGETSSSSSSTPCTGSTPCSK